MMSVLSHSSTEEQWEIWKPNYSLISILFERLVKSSNRFVKHVFTDVHVYTCTCTLGNWILHLVSVITHIIIRLCSLPSSGNPGGQISHHLPILVLHVSWHRFLDLMCMYASFKCMLVIVFQKSPSLLLLVRSFSVTLSSFIAILKSSLTSIILSVKTLSLFFLSLSFNLFYWRE